MYSFPIAEFTLRGVSSDMILFGMTNKKALLRLFIKYD